MAHLWFPLKGHMNMIRIDRERYLKHISIDLDTLNEPSSTDFPVLGNYSCDSDFNNFSPLSSDVPLTQNSEIIFQENLLTVTKETLFSQGPTEQVGGKEESGRKKENDNFFSPIWSLYFHGSKLQ
jgi:hypothetical protein